MIDIQSESLLTFSAAAKSLPGRPHLSTLHRWRMHGVRGVKLETVLVGGRRYTSSEALQRFCQRITAADRSEPAPVRTRRQREADIRRAEAELAKAGI